MLKWAFYAALVATLLALLLPAADVLAIKVWAASWLPGVRWLDQANLTQLAHSDKLGHALLFAVLGALATQAWRVPQLRMRWWWALLALGAATEGLQAWVPGRSPSLADLAADALGLLLGIAVGLGLGLGSRRPRGMSSVKP
jgi:VanZ family protein